MPDPRTGSHGPLDWGGYDALILDHDGVLVELSGTELLREALRRAFAEHGIAPTAEVVDRLKINASVEDIRDACAELGVDPEALWAARDRIVSDLEVAAVRAGEKSPYPDVDALAACPLPVGVVSNNLERTVRFVVDHAGLTNTVDAVHARPGGLASLRHRKPDPHHLAGAVAALGARNPLYVGDSDADLEAAERLGIDAAFLRRPERETYALTHEPVFEVEGLRELVERLGGRTDRDNS